SEARSPKAGATKDCFSLSGDHAEGGVDSAIVARRMPGLPFASIWFDCDSTLSAIEGVDELLRWAPAALRGEIAALTRRAMEGSLPLDAVYEQRLRLLAPRAEHLEAVGRLYCEHAVPDAREVVAALRVLGKQVGIMSGGMLPAVRALAQQLGIDARL